ncbi:MAG: IclR family transcriptional regulator [Candidatus Rokuibacteriota bacterium]|nr:MAG: IclR family transcriptional regulator [Candidatus Rokubacteria bacterium]
MRNPVSRMRTATSAVSGTAVASVARALRVLKAFADHPGGIALTRLSAELGYGKASLSKIMSTLEREGFVRRDGAGHFHLTWRLLALAFGHAQRVGISGVCMPVLQSLADETDELVQLAVIEGDHVLFVAKAEGPGHSLRLLPLVGVVAPTHATASGKVWLASLPDDRALDVMRRQGLARVTSRARLLAELRSVRRDGYAITDGELDEGGRAIAAPIVHRGRVVGAIAVSGPSSRLPLPRLKRLAPRVQRAARELEALWPHEVTARDFGLGVRPPNGDGRPARRNA